jgi:hypothetical protein
MTATLQASVQYIAALAAELLAEVLHHQRSSIQAFAVTIASSCLQQMLITVHGMLLLGLSAPISRRTRTATPAAAVTLVVLFVYTQALRTSSTLIHPNTHLAAKGAAWASWHPWIQQQLR